VFTRSGSVWSQQQEITADGTTGQAGSGEIGTGEFGLGLALSADGGTALIGGPADNSEEGAVWVFTWSGSAWSQEQELTANGTAGQAGNGEIGAGEFGNAVALSSDADTALVGGQTDDSDVGAAWVFVAAAATPIETVVPIPAAGSPPPTGSLPSNEFTITSRRADANGTIVLDVNVPGPGTLAVLGTHEDVAGGIASLLGPGAHRFDWGRAAATATRGGTIKISLHPDRDAKALLARHREHRWGLNVTVWVTYTPTAGNARSEPVQVKVLRNDYGGATPRPPPAAIKPGIR